MDGEGRAHSEEAVGAPALEGHEERSDRALAEAFLQRGDEDAVRLLYRRHGAATYRAVYRLLNGRADDAADVVQEAWITALAALPRFRWESAFSTWLLGIAVNKVRESSRRSRRRERTAAAAGLEGEVGDVEGPAPTSKRLDLRRALAELATGYREVVVLHDLRGHTHREIARILGISEGTSKSQLHQARQLLRERLRAYSRRARDENHDARLG